MNRISSQQRKLAYLVVMSLLLAPIVYLGAPGDGTENSGGKLSRLRSEYDLGETSLGNVDPASATMNLVLLGLRGIACNVLWGQAIEQKEHKDWSGLRSSVNSIVLLQPHFEAVWKFQAWNLAYNVSAEWDGVEDRYHWVKEGGKFMIQGADRNKKFPELFFDCGRITGSKVGAADEKKYFRKFFLDDPAIEGGGPDKEINPDGKDNYLVAKDWYETAIDVEEKSGIPAKKLAPVLFHSYPARAQMDYATARSREGNFDEVTLHAWEVAYDDVTKSWGTHRFRTPQAGLIVLEATDDILEELVKEDDNKFTLEQKKNWVGRKQDMAHYRYWRMQCQVEKKPEMVEAHRNLYNGKKMFLKGGDTIGAEPLLLKGLTAMELIHAEYKELEEEQDFREECIKGIILWKAALKENGKEVPTNYPLKFLIEAYPEQATQLLELFNSLYSS